MRSLKTALPLAFVVATLSFQGCIKRGNQAPPGTTEETGANRPADSNGRSEIGGATSSDIPAGSGASDTTAGATTGDTGPTGATGSMNLSAGVRDEMSQLIASARDLNERVQRETSAGGRAGSGEAKQNLQGEWDALNARFTELSSRVGANANEDVSKLQNEASQVMQGIRVALNPDASTQEGVRYSQK